MTVWRKRAKLIDMVKILDLDNIKDWAKGLNSDFSEGDKVKVVLPETPIDSLISGEGEGGEMQQDFYTDLQNLKNKTVTIKQLGDPEGYPGLSKVVSYDIISEDGKVYENFPAQWLIEA